MHKVFYAAKAGALVELDEKELNRQLAGSVNTVPKAFHEDLQKV
jgi:hypothetical protein